MDYMKRTFISTPKGVKEREIMGTSVAHIKQNLFGRRMAQSQSLFRRDLRGHYGCVNAIEFSTDGDLIASGGDDRRLLLWNISQTIFDDKVPHAINTLHISNINTCCFDADNRKVATGGNDGQVIVHDINVRQSTSVYGLSDAVYCLSPDPVNAPIIATATDDGKAQILDLRMSIDTSPFLLADLSPAMHSIMYNPAEPRLLATANSRDGIGLWDIRMPRKCINYKSNEQNCMSVRFNSSGDQLLALRRRSSPVLYDVGKMHPIYEFDYKTYYNACTLKSCSFGGLKDEYVMSGSDDFCVYLWKIPTDISENYIQAEPHMILKGHRSIVNQVRYCPYNQLIISSGVEKLIKMWSPYHIPGCTGSLLHSRRYGDDDEVERNAFSHDEYIHMVLQAGSVLSHDYTNRNTEEEPCMIAFFDSLIQREIEKNLDGDDSSSSSDSGGWGGGGGGGLVRGLSDSSPTGTAAAGPPAVEGEDASSTRDTITSTSSRLEDLTRPFYLDLESSSDSEGEIDAILNAMYGRYMSATERAISSAFRPSAKKISSVIAEGKVKDFTFQRTSSKRPQRTCMDSHHNSDQFLHESTSNMSIMAGVIDNFVDSLLARESNNSHALSDTNDGHISTDSSSSSTPVELRRQTITLHTDGPARASTTREPFSQLSVMAGNPVESPPVPVPLESGMYFMPELQAFAPESFNAVADFHGSPDPSWASNINGSVNIPPERVPNAPSERISDQLRRLRAGSSLEIVPNGSAGQAVENSSPALLTQVETSNFVTSGRTVLHNIAVPTKSSDSDRWRHEVKHCIAVPSTDAHLVRPCPVLKRTFPKSISLSSTPSCALPGNSSHHLERASSSSETVANVDSDLNSLTQDTCTSRVVSQKPMSVQFKKVKVKGKRFRVHKSRSRSSSDDDK